MTDCVFCRIIAGELPADIVYQDDLVIALNDIAPKAPVHQLIIPCRHIATINDIEEADTQLAGHMLQTGQRLAKQAGIDESGYRLVMNCNADGGQEVFHIHLHLLGGRPLHELPG